LAFPFALATTAEIAGFTHQERAWERLKSIGAAANTLVATGTGSGKTECFLYPVLQHCAAEAAAGAPGVKALIIYPMNALATDQALRLLQAIRQIHSRKPRANAADRNVASAGTLSGG